MSWIKMRHSLETDGRVRIVCAKCSLDVDTVFGKLFRYWLLADKHADENGVLFGWSKHHVDTHLAFPGFCDALPSDWIDLGGEFVKFPEYQEHNGSTAKRRASEQKRMQTVRKSVRKSVRKVSASNANASTLLSSSLSIDLKKGVQGETNPLAAAQESICDEFGKACFNHYLPIVSDWLASSGKKYKDYSAFMRNWIRRERDEGKGFFRPGAKSNAKQTNLEKAREVLYGDSRGRAGTDGVSGGGVLDVPSDSGKGGNLDGRTPSVLPRTIKKGS